MQIRYDQLVKSIGAALDMVERELLGTGTNHGKRVAVLCCAMGKLCGIRDTFALAAAALLHDNALTQHKVSEHDLVHGNLHMHCTAGQHNANLLAFMPGGCDYILHHHERADGRGPFARREGEFSAGAALVAAADMADARHHLQTAGPDGLAHIRQWIAAERGTRLTQAAAQALLAVLDAKMLQSLQDERIAQTASDAIPHITMDIQDSRTMSIAALAAKIIDYKSAFTHKHTVQIAARAWLMGKYYKFDRAQLVQTYLAASLHDIGKLGVPSAVLEKPGKLTADEFGIIKSHITITRDLLSEIAGFEQSGSWAASHHEKLDGTGYPLGKNAAELDFISRLMACVDIYQAVSEERPYHPARDHAQTMDVLNSMAQAGLIDAQIAADMDVIMQPYSLRDVPLPRLCCDV